VAPESRDAVVSDPPTIKMLEFDTSSASLRPSFSPRCLSIASMKSPRPCRAVLLILFCTDSEVRLRCVALDPLNGTGKKRR
jgi:hypothetical protein